ncbi:ADAMTS-like no long nerve cord [Brevipalpus obovatus]|uniref:ADAMTS-like no long nerve cord n=1 Tax=Brevipalpus obovatus TaxID=246614 RepID=UPI003D9DFEED
MLVSQARVFDELLRVVIRRVVLSLRNTNLRATQFIFILSLTLNGVTALLNENWPESQNDLKHHGYLPQETLPEAQNVDATSFHIKNTKENLEKTSDLSSSFSFDESQNLSTKIQPDGWSEWGPWSECSKPCDVGISCSHRKCLSSDGCDGSSSTRYKICNIEPCSNEIDLRAAQCAQFNSRRFNGVYYQWLPHRDRQNPCNLTCKAKSHNLLVQWGPHFADGTKCGQNSYDICIGGVCIAVGCDLEIGSGKKIDECGVCGGNGSTCKNGAYQWQANYSECTSSCGKGYQIPHMICIDTTTNVSVDVDYCEYLTKPKSLLRPCDSGPCLPRWTGQQWSSCSVPCGGGFQRREVYCSEPSLFGPLVRASSDDRCAGILKPTIEQPCNTHQCPQWFEGPWSECSASCGGGYRTREIICRDHDGQLSNNCEISLKPTDKEECSSLPCQEASIQRDEPPSIKDGEPRFYVEEWGSCEPIKGSCGKGIRRRTVECQMPMSLSGTLAVEMTYCSHAVRPASEESCKIPCPNPPAHSMVSPNEVKQPEAELKKRVHEAARNLNPTPKSATYYWRTQGFTDCSAACLGGTRESKIFCIRDSDGMSVSHYLCSIADKPDSVTESCNEHPCPPRWDMGEFEACSKRCDGGVQKRRVECIHEIARGADNKIVLDDEECPQPKPIVERVCNEQPCPSKKCSQDSLMDVNSIECSENFTGNILHINSSSISEMGGKLNSKTMTEVKKKCRKPCSSGVRRKDRSKRRVRVKTLKIGTHSAIYRGDTLKIPCPHPNPEKGGPVTKDEIKWFKNSLELYADDKFQITKRGDLRIRNVSVKDAGVYVCKFGQYELALRVDVRGKPIRSKPRNSIPTNDYSSNEVLDNSKNKDSRI